MQVRLCFLFSFFLIAGISTISSGQQKDHQGSVRGPSEPSTGYSFSATNPNSTDYRVVYGWTFNANYCDCSNLQAPVTTLQINTAGGQINLDQAQTAALNYTHAVGPNYYDNAILANMHFTGRKSWWRTLNPADDPWGCSVFATCNPGVDCNCDYVYPIFAFVGTEPIKDPVSVSATDGSSETQITISWGHGTDIPHGQHSYKIYRDDQEIVTLPGSTTSYNDSGLTPGSNHTYKVTTFTNLWGGHESGGVSDEGSTFSMIASDGDFFNRTRITWSNVPLNTEDIRIERSLPTGGTEELAIMSASAKTYNDLGAIPGYVYTYYVRPLVGGTPIITYSDNGYSRPNGIISGTVLSTLGAGVQGAEIEVELKTLIPPGGMALPPNCPMTYCAVTDASGYYEIKNVFYFTGAEFIVRPDFPGTITHIFTPDSLIRSIDENARVASGVDFTDQTVISIGGNVSFPPNPANPAISCGVEGATILVDGNDTGIRTNEDGDWLTGVTTVGTYTYSVSYNGHDFETPMGDTSYTILVNSDSLTLDFENKTRRSIRVVAQGGCQASLGNSVTISINATPDCFYKEYVTGPDGVLELSDLPPRDYEIMITNIDPPNTNILTQLNNSIEVDLTDLDTMVQITEKDTLVITPPDTTILPGNVEIITPADTSIITKRDTISTTTPLVRFIYRSPVEIITDFGDAGAIETNCIRPWQGENDKTVVMEQGNTYVMQFLVKETLGVDCYIDTGTLVIYDEISDRENTGVRVPIKNGVATYVVEPGDPDIATSPTFNHEKFLFIAPEIDFLEIEPVTYWVVVTGIRSNAPTYFTRTPEIPQLIIHDPPGDNSYAFVEEGTSFTTFTSTEIRNDGAGGVFFNLKGGPQGKIFGTTIKAGAGLEFEFNAGRNNLDEDGYYLTTTFTKDFSTSTDELFVGNDGDVYIGAAFNQIFALSDELNYDPGSCMADVDTILEMDYSDFATTFIYTEFHIKNILLPTIGTLKSLQDTTTDEGKVEYNKLTADSILWQQIINDNNRNRDTTAQFIENISISSGAARNQTYETVNGVKKGYTYEAFIETSLKAFVEVGVDAPFLYLESQLGAMGTYRWSQTEIRDTTEEDTRTVGFTLEDNDIGDFLSIDILQDTFYDVPAFKLVSGTTSCPHEENTQTRVKPDIDIYPPKVDNVPRNDAANFIVSLTNISDSKETWEYFARVVSSTNPDGALIRLGGALINASPVGFFLDHDQTQQMILSVERGPLASNYENIGIMMYPECEYDLWQAGGTLENVDTVWFSVNFQSQCSNVSIVNPVQNWLVNQNSNDELLVTLGGYDYNNPLLDKLTLQVKKDGGGYVDYFSVEAGDLSEPYVDIFLDVSSFEDGGYTLRAKANCGVEGGITYSSEFPGFIDRSSLAPFGVPTPSDGFLQAGQTVGVKYDKPIACGLNYPYEASLTRLDDSTTIPMTVQCSGNEILFVTNPPLTDMPGLEGVEVQAHLHLLQDENGNVQKYPVDWSFLVNVKPVFWDPEDIYASSTIGGDYTFTGTIKNSALISKAFSLDTADAPEIIQVPGWMKVLQTRGTVLANNEYTVEFLPDPDLVPGIYTGIVTAAVDGLPVSVNVTFELLARPVSWSFNPNLYERSMNVVAQISTTDLDTPLSSDTRDLVAAFVNGEIRGIANIEYVPELDTYAAFLTVYSNDNGGNNSEEISFRFWKALTGIEYGAEETTTFQINGKVGSPSAPLILHPKGIFQVLSLNQGWNWISFNVSSGDMPKEEVFASLIYPSSNNTITVKSQNGTTSYTPGSGWNGALSNLPIGFGYLVHLSDHGDTLRVLGNPPATPPFISFNKTWNWIGFPEQEARPVDSVLGGLSPNVGQVLKGQYGFTEYTNSNVGYVGNLQFFEPGKGYKLEYHTDGAIQFRGPGKYKVDPGLYEYNMNVTGYLDPARLDGSDYRDLKVGAFIEEACYGVGELEYVAALDEYRVLMLVHGGPGLQGQPLDFRILNERTGIEYPGNGDILDFVPDGLMGSIPEPYHFFSTKPQGTGLDDYALFQNRPNPFSHKTLFEFKVPVESTVRFEIYDMNGHLLDRIQEVDVSAGRHQLELDLNAYAPGVYMYRMITEGFSATRKMVRK